jgi:hypothetical protein
LWCCASADAARFACWLAPTVPYMFKNYAKCRNLSQREINRSAEIAELPYCNPQSPHLKILQVQAHQHRCIIFSHSGRFLITPAVDLLTIG